AIACPVVAEPDRSPDRGREGRILRVCTYVVQTSCIHGSRGPGGQRQLRWKLLGRVAARLVRGQLDGDGAVWGVVEVNHGRRSLSAYEKRAFGEMWQRDARIPGRQVAALHDGRGVAVAIANQPHLYRLVIARRHRPSVLGLVEVHRNGREAGEAAA